MYVCVCVCTRGRPADAQQGDVVGDIRGESGHLGLLLTRSLTTEMCKS